MCNMNIKRPVVILLTCLLVLASAGQAEAQFWKKKSKRHHSKKHKEEINTTDTAGASASADSRRDTKKTKAEKKRERKEKRRKEKEERYARREEERRLRKEARKSKNKQKTNTNTTAEPAKPTATEPVGRKWSGIEYAPTVKKPHYRVDILAAMYLDELVKNGYPVKEIPEKAVAGLDFYKGVQIAADTLKKAQFDIDIYVHDVASAQESTEMLVSKDMMDSSDLIIGAVPTRDIAALATYAKSKHINFISALSPADGGVRDNQYLTLLQPSLKSHCEWIEQDIEGMHLRKKPVLLYRNTSMPDENAYKYLMGAKDKKAPFTPLLCNTIPTKDILIKLIDTAHANVLVIATIDLPFADSLLHAIKHDFPGVRFIVYGMPTWNNLPLLQKPAAMANFSFSYTTPFNYDPQSPQGSYIAHVFKKEYGGKPQELVFRGYEAMFWYANLLKRYGTIFNKQYADSETAPFTRFDVKPQWDEAGNVMYHENRHIYLKNLENGVMSIR